MHAALRRAPCQLPVPRHELWSRTSFPTSNETAIGRSRRQSTSVAPPVSTFNALRRVPLTGPPVPTRVRRAIRNESVYIPSKFGPTPRNVNRLRSYMKVYQVTKLARSLDLTKVFMILSAIRGLKSGHHLPREMKEGLLFLVDDYNGGPREAFLSIAMHMLTAAQRDPKLFDGNKDIIGELLHVVWDYGSEQGISLAGYLLLKPVATSKKAIYHKFVSDNEAGDIYDKLVARKYYAVHLAWGELLYDRWTWMTPQLELERQMLARAGVAELQKAYELCEDVRMKSMAAEGLGIRYAKGEMFPQDMARAMKWFEAALLEDSKAHSVAARLASIHMGRLSYGADSSTFTRDPRKIVGYLEIAAPRNPWAAYEAGIRYYLDPVELPHELSVSEHVQRWDVGPDDRRAAMYFYFGYTLGDIPSRIKLAEMLLFHRVDPSAFPKRTWGRHLESNLDEGPNQTDDEETTKSLGSVDVENPPLPAFMDPLWAKNFTFRLAAPLWDGRRKRWSDFIPQNSPLRWLPIQNVPDLSRFWDEMTAGLHAQGKLTSKKAAAVAAHPAASPKDSLTSSKKSKSTSDQLLVDDVGKPRVQLRAENGSTALAGDGAGSRRPGAEEAIALTSS